MKIRIHTTPASDLRSVVDPDPREGDPSPRWREVHEGERIVAQIQPRGRTLAVRGSEPEWSQIVRAIGWPIQTERRQPTITIPLPLMGTGLDRIGHGALEAMRIEKPGWRDWIIADQEVHERRKRREGQLARISRARDPNEIRLGSEDLQGELFKTGSSPFPTLEVPEDHPYHQLRPYQQAGVQLLLGAEMRFVLGDDMGLGKTPTSLVSLDLHPLANRILIVCPKIVARNWAVEAKIWAPHLTVEVAQNGTKVKKWCRARRGPGTKREALVVTWGLLEPCLEDLAAVPWTSIAADEEHQAKEIGSSRTRALLAIGYGVPHRIGVTGTPMMNRPTELFALLHFVDPIAFPQFIPFAERYGAPRDVRVGGGRTIREYRGASHEDELNQIVRPYLIRRTKEEVLHDLPPQIEKTIHIECPKAIIEECAAVLRAIRTAEDDALPRFTKLRQAVGLAKTETAVAWLLEMHAQGEPAIVFLAHHPVREAIEEGLTKAKIAWKHIIGDTSQKQRQTIKEEFQRGEIPVLLGTDAMRDGITLTRAAYSLHVERWYTPAGEDQAKSRIHRFGQQREAVHTFLHLDDSFDDWFVELLATKDERIRKLHDRSDLEALIWEKLKGGPT